MLRGSRYLMSRSLLPFGVLPRWLDRRPYNHKCPLTYEIHVSFLR